MNRKLIAAAACGLVLSACSSAPSAKPAAPTPPTPAPSASAPSAPTPAPPPASVTSQRPALVPRPADLTREYKTNNFAERWNTTGALVFDSVDAVKACFSRVYFGRNKGFRPCEEKTIAILPQGVPIKLLEAFDADAIAKIEVLDGEKKGLIGYTHELWIAPSPWE